MNVVVIPAKDEEPSIKLVLDVVDSLGVDLIIPVVNGCKDKTALEVLNGLWKTPIRLLEFKEALGIDMPRAIGALYAQKCGATSILFLDGDMSSIPRDSLNTLIESVSSNKTDMALTNCYPFIYPRNSLANQVLKMREKLNRQINRFHELGLASPAHGPHAVSHRFLEEVPLHEIALPPVSMAIAARKCLSITVEGSIHHKLLGSPIKDTNHGKMVAYTIIGDSLEAISAYKHEPRSRVFHGVDYGGYHPQRRFDIFWRLMKD